MIRDNYLDISKIIRNKKILRLFRAVEDHGGVLRFVGGAVRDAIMGIEGFDIDLATDLSPDELVEACAERNLRTVPIGIKFGTVGVVIENDLYEVTSLRRDTYTDSRYPVVEFTDNWEVDASRRDLTINAVYADEKGNVFDYYNGIEDLENGVVKFIGKADIRIKEDYLRILRFFRFYSIFGKGKIDAKALKACSENKDGLKTLSIERMGVEISKLLVTPNVVKTIEIMNEHEILASFLPSNTKIECLAFLLKITKGVVRPREAIRRFFALYMPDEKLAENLATRLKFTKKQKDMFIKLSNTEVTIESFQNNISLLKMVYYHGKEFCMDSFLLKLVKDKVELDNIDEILEKIDDAIIPVFPIRGRDVIAAGISEPLKIGKILDELEKIWVESGFVLNRDDLAEIAVRNFAQKDTI